MDRHLEKVRSIITRDYTASQMNDTRWMALLDALRGLPLWWRFKLVTEERVYGWTRQLEGGSGSFLPSGGIEGVLSPFRCLELEWLEVLPVDDPEGEMAAEVERRLAAIRVPFTHSGEGIRITGHLRSPGVDQD